MFSYTLRRTELMKKFTGAIISVFILFALLLSPGCKEKAEKVEKEGYETTKTQLEETKASTDILKKSIEELRMEVQKLEKEVDKLTFEKQILLAEKKRLEADVIELRIGVTPTPTEPEK
jgi:uncharacterized protein YlxW (UPF0749 family)